MAAPLPPSYLALNALGLVALAVAVLALTDVLPRWTLAVAVLVLVANLVGTFVFLVREGRTPPSVS